MYHFEACNLVVVLLFVYAAFRRQVIPPYVFLVLTITSFTPFVLNDFLFPASYMPDQSMYLEIVQQVRSFDFAALESSSIFNIQVKTAALLFAFSPIPFMQTVHSLAICNHLVYAALIIWLYSRKNLRGWPFLFVLLYPSFIFYSSLALRDTFIVAFMVIATVFFIEEKWKFTGAAMVFLCLLKPQNAILLALFFLICTFSGSSILKIRQMFISLSIFALVLLFYATMIEGFHLKPFAPQIIGKLNTHREFMFLSNGGNQEKLCTPANN